MRGSRSIVAAAIVILMIPPRHIYRSNASCNASVRSTLHVAAASSVDNFTNRTSYRAPVVRQRFYGDMPV
jgi:hypothetical protein